VAYIAKDSPSLIIKGVGRKVEIAEGKEVTQSILKECYPLNTKKFVDNLLAGGHIEKAKEAPKKEAPPPPPPAPEGKE